MWTYGRELPALGHLPAIADALNLPPLHFPQLMGIVVNQEPSTNLVKLSLQVEALKHQRQELLEMLGRLRESSGTSQVVAAAVRAGIAIAVWPASEGPDDFRCHVADRITLKPTMDAKSLPDPLGTLSDTLRQVGAVRRTVTRSPGWLSADDDSRLHFSIDRLGAPHPPARTAPVPGLRSLGVYSLTVMAWASNVAAHLADAFGMGLTSTRSLATSIYGVSLMEDDLARHRFEMLEHLLGDSPLQYVWYHFGVAPSSSATPRSPICSQPSQAGSGMFLIRLRESDRVLQEAILSAREQGRSPTTTLQMYKEIRSLEDAALSDDPSIISVDIDEEDAGTGSRPASLNSLREAKFRRSLNVAATCTRSILAHTGLRVTDLYDSPFTRWMATRNGKES